MSVNCSLATFEQINKIIIVLKIGGWLDNTFNFNWAVFVYQVLVTNAACALVLSKLVYNLLICNTRIN